MINNIDESADFIINKLNLAASRKRDVKKLLREVYAYKLNKYVLFVRNNPDFISILKTKLREQIFDDNWDVAVFLYRLNIKISTSLYPYLFIFETTLKTKVNEYMIKKYGKDWIRHNKNYLNECKIKVKNKELEKYNNDQKYIEKDTTLGFWTGVIQYKHFWNNQSQGFYLKQIFNIEISELEEKIIFSHLESVRLLRNKVSHYNDILLDTIFDRKIPLKHTEQKTELDGIIPAFTRYYSSKDGKVMGKHYQYKVINAYKSLLGLYKLLENKDIDNAVKSITPYSECFEDLYEPIQFCFDVVDTQE